MKKSLMMIALGKGPKGPSDEEDDDGMEYGRDEESHDDETDGSSAALSAAQDLIDAVRSKDPQAVVEAFMALDSSCSDGDPSGPDDDSDR